MRDNKATDKKKPTAIMGRPDEPDAKPEAKKEKADPRPLLEKALARHDLHASGAEPADEYSNTKLRDDLQAALDALNDDIDAEAQDKESA